MSSIYTKRKWINDQTKLSAKNLNHIEDGIEAVADAVETLTVSTEALAEDKQDALVSGINIKTINEETLLGSGNISLKVGDGHVHDNKAILDQITLPYTEEAKSELNAAIANKSRVSVSADGDAAMKVQYITIDGVEYKLAGGDSIPKYKELDGRMLDSLVADGVYKLTNVTDAPKNTDNGGILEVETLEGNNIKQEWFSNTNYAIRIISGDAPTKEFYVNDVLVPQGEVALEAGGVYRLSGELDGEVRISGAVTKYTTLILDGVTINTTTASAINHVAKTHMSVELAGSSENVLLVKDEETLGDDSSIGALHCEGDMTVFGTGYLSIVNTKGHGIKASDTRFGGKPKIYIDAHHDGVHSKSLYITEGNFYIKRANDAFSAGSDKNAGKMVISGGEIAVESCRENAFQAKNSTTVPGQGSMMIYGDTQIILQSEFDEFDAFNAGTGEVKWFDTASITAPAGTTLPAKITLATYYGDPIIEDSAGSQVLPIERVFTLDAAESTYYATGNFSGYKIVAAAKKINLVLNGVYYYNSDAADEGAFIEYTAGSKRLEFKLGANTVNYIHKAAGACIKSNKNIVINDADSAGDLFLECPAGYGIYVPEGDVRLENDGARYISGCNVGVYANLLAFGDEPGEVDGSKKKFTFAYIYDSTTNDVVLKSRTDSAGAYVVGSIVATENDYGFSLLGLVENESVDDAATIEATSGKVSPEGVEYTRNSTLYCLANDLAATNVTIYDEASLQGEPIPVEISEDIKVNEWKVYDNYLWQSAFAAMQANYDVIIANLTLRIEALEAGRTTYPTLDANGNLTLHNTSVDIAGDLNLSGLALISEDSSLIL